jgi:cytochrome c
VTTRLFHALAIGLGVLAGHSAAVLADDITDGATTFHTCAACHSLEPGKTKVGPSLHGLFGRKAGTLPGFSYTEAMKNSGFTWSEATLTTYLHAPREAVPGTRMAFGGIKDDAKLRALIEYLKSATQ